MKCSIFLATLAFAFSINSLSAIESNNKLDILEMKRKLQDQNHLVTTLEKEVQNVEVNLGMQNKKYLKLSEDRIKLEESLNIAKKNADLDEQNLKKNISETKNILMGLVLNKIEKAEDPSEMLSRKVLIENLQKRLTDLDSLIKINQSLQGEVTRLNARLDSSMSTEKDLLALMKELEEKKAELKNKLDSETKKKQDLSQNFDESKNKLAIERENKKKEKLKEKVVPIQITEEVNVPSHVNNIPVSKSGDYLAPIALFHVMEHQEKGVTFTFQGKNEVKAPRAGKVVYTGSLGGYGNVLMIDHGSDTRSVLLGQFEYLVKNGEQVGQLQVVGRTIPSSNQALGGGKIYFEVRKNNLAQNTYLLIDKKSLTR